MKRSAPVKKRRSGTRRGPPEIPAAEFRCPKYIKFLRKEGYCMACGGTGGWMGCDPAHGPVNGTSSKGPDREAGPLCGECHGHQHRMGWPAFEALFRFSREEKAAEWWKRFKEQR